MVFCAVGRFVVLVAHLIQCLHILANSRYWLHERRHYLGLYFRHYQRYYGHDFRHYQRYYGHYFGRFYLRHYVGYHFRNFYFG